MRASPERALPALCAAALLAGGGCAGGPACGDLTGALAATGLDPGRTAVLVRRLEDGACWQAGGARLDRRYPPASTAKVPHTLIALETGAVRGPDHPFPWDGTDHGGPGWNRDQTLRTAFRRSAPWVYQDIAAGLGSVTMGRWLRRLGYGNADVGGPDRVTTYWLAGPLAISAREQVDFLARLARDELPVSPATRAAALAVMREERDDGTVLHAKTGWARDGLPVDLGWYVGWWTVPAAEGTRTYVFALDTDMADPQRDRARRRAAVLALLAGIDARGNRP